MILDRSSKNIRASQMGNKVNQGTTPCGLGAYKAVHNKKVRHVRLSALYLPPK
jgi:hypothetical protein